LKNIVKWANIISLNDEYFQLVSHMKLDLFFDKHPVFTSSELRQFIERDETLNELTLNALLDYHREKGRIGSIKGGLYFTVPRGSDPEAYPVDPWLVTSRMASDAVLSHHSALSFYGKTYSVARRFTYLSNLRLRPVKFREYEFKSTLFPEKLKEKKKELFDVKTLDRSGLDVKVTSFERTLVDLLDRPELGIGWEEIWRSLETVEYFNLDRVIEYAIMLGNATTIAKTGFYLDQHRESLKVKDGHLEKLKKYLPKQKRYMVYNNRENCRLVKDWNLIVPVRIVDRSWEEFA
jgi:predicted transcriptional regulator of viral defense system